MINLLKEFFICNLFGHKFSKHGKYLYCRNCEKIAVVNYVKKRKN